MITGTTRIVIGATKRLEILISRLLQLNVSIKILPMQYANEKCRTYRRKKLTSREKKDVEK